MAYITFILPYATDGYAVPHVQMTLRRGDMPPTRLSVSMHSADGYIWRLSINASDTEGTEYRYAIMNGSSVVRSEEQHKTLPASISGRITVRDYWADKALPDYLTKEGLMRTLYPNTHIDSEHSIESEANGPMIEYVLQAPPTTDGGYYAIVGEDYRLGAWDAMRAVRMTMRNMHEWHVSIPLDEMIAASEYKYVYIRTADGAQEAVWEEGDNRHTMLPHHEDAVCHDGLWRGSLPLWRGAGVVLPLFSIKTDSTFGVGDTTSLGALIDWCAEVGMRAVQLLPINDTSMTGTWRDSYPYNSLSVFALHPMYLDVPAMGELSPTDSKEYCKMQARLNALPKVDYELVNKHKWHFIRKQYAKHGEAVMNTNEYKHFCHAHKEWLYDYAAFCYFKDSYGTADFRTWPAFSVYDAEAVEQLMRNDATAKHETDMYVYVQYELHRQFQSVKERASRKGILLKGDIPIGISRDSDSAWVEPHLFNFDEQAGAPPDAFATDGQNWGFPTYNWEQHERENYNWWKRRLSVMSQLFDAYRIDHVLGFFRIWEIPYGTISGLLGQFSPALGFTAAEMADFGFTFDAELHTYPSFTSEELSMVLGENANPCTTRLFCPDTNDASKRYSFAKEIDCQKTLRHTIASDSQLAQLPDDAKKSLMSMMTDVLFVADRREANVYHPRIGGHKTLAYARLSQSMKTAFDTLHHDYYYRRNYALWQTEAVKKLTQITQACDLLPCAEDLGMLPDGVQEVLQRLSMLSLEIQTMPKEPWVEFANTDAYPYLSVATFATHDMPPLRNWWAEDSERAKRFYHSALGMGGTVPKEADTIVCTEVLRRHLASPSMLCLMSFQDWTAAGTGVRSKDFADEQINRPADPDQYWQYRMHITVEELSANEAFAHLVRGLISDNAR